jgi:hypothetical protein
MKLARFLRRVVVVGVAGTMLSLGMGVAAAPAHAMPRDCNYYLERAVYWFNRYVHETNTTRANAYLAASEAAWDVWYEQGCRPR